MTPGTHQWRGVIEEYRDRLPKVHGALGEPERVLVLLPRTVLLKCLDERGRVREAGLHARERGEIAVAGSGSWVRVRLVHGVQSRRKGQGVPPTTAETGK